MSHKSISHILIDDVPVLTQICTQHLWACCEIKLPQWGRCSKQRTVQLSLHWGCKRMRYFQWHIKCSLYTWRGSSGGYKCSASSWKVLSKSSCWTIPPGCPANRGFLTFSFWQVYYACWQRNASSTAHNSKNMTITCFQLCPHRRVRIKLNMCNCTETNCTFHHVPFDIRWEPSPT